jgi:acetyltransferase-like isoleucine patch superfamily enzyme
MKKILSLIEQDGIFAFFNIFDYLFNKILSYSISMYFNTKISLSSPFFIKGFKYIKLGEGFSAGKGLWLEAVSKYLQFEYEPRIMIGKNVKLSKNVHISSINEIAIGSNVLIGSNVYIGDHQHGSYGNNIHSNPDSIPSERKLISHRKIYIEDNTWIGDNVVILGGAIIRYGSIIGANSLVNCEIKDRVIAAGNPIKIIKEFKDGAWISVK